MSNNWDKIFEGYECPDNKMLQDYLDGKLSGKEKHHVEKHLIDCEMCSDELEGLILLENRKDLDKIVENIKPVQLKSQVRIIPFITKYRIYLAAAAVVILGAIILLLKEEISGDNKPLVADLTETVEDKSAINEIKQPNDVIQEQTEKAETMENKEGVVKAEAKTFITPSDIPEEDKKIVEVHDAVSNIAGEVTNDQSDLEEDMGAVVADEIVISQQEVIAVEKITENKTKKEIANGVKVDKSDELARYSEGEKKDVRGTGVITSKAPAAMDVETISTKTAKPNSTDMAMEKFNAGKYKSALKLFEDMISSDSTNYEAMYYAAHCYKELKNVDKAILLLNKILMVNGNSYYNDAFILREEILKK